MLRRDGLIVETILDNIGSVDVDKRDLDRVVLNVMESLIESGLATQVVKASLKDPQFFTFSASLLDTLYGQGHLKLLALMAAIS